MFVTRARFKRECARLENAVAQSDAIAAAQAERARTAQAQLADARAYADRWATLATEAVNQIATLQRRYAPPAPIDGDVRQPLTVAQADAKAAEAHRERQREADR